MTESLHQTITLDDNDLRVVFTSDGRVFYDVEFMADILAQDVMRRTAMVTQDADAAELGYLMGQADMVNNIMQQAAGFSMAYSLDSVEGVEDMFGPTE